MARTDDDSWDITESVGSTALGVAAARAAETDSDDPLIEDPYAKLFLAAAGDGMWNTFASGTLSEELADVDGELGVRMRAMRDYVASRTVFFDEFFLAATNGGVRQAVILAAGLDARGWRLQWPDGTTVYELDQPKVLDFKGGTLAAKGARPSAVLVNVPVDLRHDWPKALRQAGFDTAAPTAWSAEGLLPFLTAQAQDTLFERINELSAPGSRIAVEAMSSDAYHADGYERQRKQLEKFRAAAAKLHQREMPDVGDLWYWEERTDVGEWLRNNGWEVSVATAEELLSRHDRRPPEGVEDATPQSLFVSAQRSQY
ncbi:class I SAM-dependent methyltransferase [Mycobacterium sp.]|jgi:methyltransferase (TIGR00027 family)|uniref:class I SAM-dependent methyltransferase n=1 Tax=Mycobacterium sp. TaxID=1785 RepID=UPI002D35DF95|nr:class I SAM-dependent methyltransferase [Mycobacterium sp.]HZA08804.1 class I SAM-dependent methyltransferase [Mycobacterium sp.]